MNLLSRELLNCLFIEHLNITKLIPGGQDYFNSTDLHLKFIKKKKKKEEEKKEREKEKEKEKTKKKKTKKKQQK